jgi:hypothetical protein
MSQTKVEKQFIKNNRPFRNLLINGDMKIWQRYGGSAVTISDGSNEGYNSVDRWNMSFGGSAGGAIQWSRSTDVPAGEDFEYSLKMSPSTTTAATGTQELRFYQAIESQNIPDLAYGTSGAKTLTFSFYFKTNKVGLYSVYFQHRADEGTAKRKFLTFTPAASDTWERIVLKVTGDTATAQTMDDSSAGLYIYFTLDNTPDYDIDATEQDWTTSTILSSENNVNFFDNTSNELYLTGCQLEVGDTPSDYEFLPYDVQLQRCMRYYYDLASTGEFTDAATYISMGAYYTASYVLGFCHFPVPMRAEPTLTTTNASNTFYFYTAGSTGNGVGDGLDDLFMSGASSKVGAMLANSTDASGPAGYAGGIFLNADKICNFSAEL